MFVWSGSELLCYLEGKAPHIYDPGRQNASPGLANGRSHWVIPKPSLRTSRSRLLRVTSGRLMTRS